MFIIYDLTFIIFGLFYLPVLLFKGKAHKGFKERLGIFSADLKEALRQKNNLWVHAVSVGEVAAVSRLLEHLRKMYPSCRMVISTVTPAGNKLARKFAKPGELVIYFPLDLSFIAAKFIKYVRPRAFITAETEIWPNLLLALQKENIPVILVNGRISAASFRGYKFVASLLRGVLNSIRLFCMQTEADSQRIKEIGAPAERVITTGNLKFDAVPPAGTKFRLADLGFEVSDRLFICGSTHPREEEMVLAAFEKLLPQFPNLKLLLAPRHIERSKEVEAILDKHNLKHIRFSQICGGACANSVIVLDTIGNLGALYSLAEVVFMGGSLVKKGGHNILEPAIFGKPVVFGPFMFNFKDICEIFLSRQAAIRINNPQELEGAVRKLLLDKNLREELGNAALKIIAENKGATEKTAALITKIIS